MGVTNSKRIYEEGKDDAPKSGAESGKDEGAASEDKGAPEEKGPEAKEEPAGGIDRTEADKWKPFFKDVLKLSQAKDKIKTLILDEKASKDIYGKKGIIISKNDVTDFTNGEKEYIADLVLFLKDGIPNKKGEPPLKFDKEKAEPLTTGPQADNNGKQIRNLKPDTDFKVLDKDYMDPIISATKLALKHKKFLKVLQEYILKTDTFKKAHKDEFIEDKKEDVKKGDKTVADAVEENDNKKEVSAKEGEGEGAAKEGAAKEGEAKEGEGEAKEGGDGGYDSDGSSNYSGGSSNLSFSSDSDTSSSSISMDAGSMTEIASMTGGGSITESGGGIVPNMLLTNKQIRKNKGKADYKKFKKETRANFDEKTKQFFNDTTAVDTFMEDNETDLLALMYYQTGVPLKWIDKSKKDEKKKVADALLKAITEYKPPEAPPAEGEKKTEEGAADGAAAPPAADGDKDKDKEGAAAPPADGDKDKKPDAAAEGGGAEILAAEIEKLSAKIQGLTGASSLTDAVADAMQSQTGGGGSSKKHSKKDKKKRKTNKKGSKKINININLGKKNTISDSDCSSSSSSSDTSSSSSDSSSSSSDSETSSSSSESDSSHREKKKRRRRNKKKSKRKSK